MQAPSTHAPKVIPAGPELLQVCSTRRGMSVLDNELELLGSGGPRIASTVRQNEDDLVAMLWSHALRPCNPVRHPGRAAREDYVNTPRTAPCGGNVEIGKGEERCGSVLKLDT